MSSKLLTIHQNSSQ